MRGHFFGPENADPEAGNLHFFWPFFSGKNRSAEAKKNRPLARVCDPCLAL
jgi:hypothetical protein